MIKLPKFTHQAAVQRISLHKRAALQALNDIEEGRIFYVCFDHSLVSPWLHSSSPKGLYPIIGHNIFRYYEAYGPYIPYKLTINFSTFIEIQDQIAHSISHLKHAGQHLLNSAKSSLVSRSQVTESLSKYKNAKNSLSINRSHFNTLFHYISSGSIIGTNDEYHEIAAKFQYSKDDINRYAKIIEEYSEYNQANPQDARMHLQLDAFRPAEVDEIHRLIDNARYAYSGGSIISSLCQRGNSYKSRHPLTILCALYAFAQAYDSPDIKRDAVNWLKDKYNSLDKCEKLLNNHNYEYKNLKTIDRRKVSSVEAIFIVSMYEYSDDPVMEDLDLGYVTEYIMNSNDIKDQVERDISNHENIGNEFNKSIKNNIDENIYAGIEDIFDADTIARIDEIKKTIGEKPLTL